MPNNPAADDGVGPISDRTLDALRTTAALVAAVPNVAAQLRFGDEVFLEVRRPPFPESPHRVMPVCVFHGAVAGALQMRRSGERIAMHGVSGAVEPAIDWGIAGGGSVLPGGMLRLARGDRWWHVAAMPVGVDAVRKVLRTGDVHHVALHGDDGVEVTIAHCNSPAGDESASAAAVDALVGIVAAAGTADLERRLMFVVR